MYEYKYILICASIFLFHIKTIDGNVSNETIPLLKAPKQITDIISLLEKEKSQLLTLQNRLNFERQQFRQEQEAVKQIVTGENRVYLNVGGTRFETTVETLTKVPNTKLAKIFDGTYTRVLQRNQDGKLIASLDYNPRVFRHLLNQLRRLKPNEKPNFLPPPFALLVEPYNNMLKDLGLPIPSKSDNDIIALNVGGEKVATYRKTLTGVPNSKLAVFASDAKDLKRDRVGRPFLDYNPNLFHALLNQLRSGKKITDKNFVSPTKENQNAFQAMIKSLSQTDAKRKNSKQKLTKTTSKEK